MKSRSRDKQAFPVYQGEGCEPTSGMTLLDWFAGQALHALIRNAGNNADMQELALQAYVAAELMCEERDDPQGEGDGR